MNLRCAHFNEGGAKTARDVGRRDVTAASHKGDNSAGGKVLRRVDVARTDQPGSHNTYASTGYRIYTYLSFPKLRTVKQSAPFCFDVVVQESFEAVEPS